ncbi:lipopolysaccharide biosynthesis protein [Marinobacter pelagius]|uniref:XrtA system polysaccharide chain length determinant n=1 Tax=Marinobacter sp. C7 TaxID=2951363 RepID=UPI001EEF80DB|nr:XrtA system polysaccharide chain length determinant [Marinobacter sp. C7]MCG7199459.1 lipopolysaccharide biosynthesis protein [Marinobacter sp. C7]
MDMPLSQLPNEILREVRSRKWLALVLFTVVSFGVLLAGFLWPYKYESQVVIFVDDRNIIRPLMEGSAVTTQINDRASAAQELLWSRSIMETIAKDTALFGPDAATLEPEELEDRIATLRRNVSVEPRGDSYFSIGFAAASPNQAFQVAQKLGQLFIEETSERKRAESRNAYEFIDKQVKSYEQQLASVEERLKNFLSVNVDGTESEANQRIASLRGQIEVAEMERQELMTRARSLEGELARINPMLLQGRSEDIYQTRIQSLQEQLDNLRLKYHDTYPDIVILREQIDELRKQRQQALASENPERVVRDGESISNPVYQEVRSSLAETRASIQTTETRIRALKLLLAEQARRMERIQDNKAEYAELTRDMEVNKEIYDDLLKRREKARVSMHLDVEGQGLNYRINEAAQFPRGTSGPRFSTFAVAGLFLGLLAPFGLVAGLLQIDPRIRARQQLEESLGFPVLAELPEMKTPYEKRRERRVLRLVILCGIAVALVYVSIAVGTMMGVIA